MVSVGPVGSWFVVQFGAGAYILCNPENMQQGAVGCLICFCRVQQKQN